MSHDHAHDRATDTESTARDRFVEALDRKSTRLNSSHRT